MILSDELGAFLRRMELDYVIAQRCKRNVLNYVETMLFLARLKESATVRFRRGLTIDCCGDDRQFLLFLLDLSDEGLRLTDSSHDDPHAWKVTWETRRITTPQGLTFQLEGLSNDSLIFKETFLYDIHFVDFDLRGKSVVDVGGFVGDTALYYARLGALVYVYEPNPDNFKHLLRNLELNPEYQRKVKIRNSAVGRDEKVTFYYTAKASGGGSADCLAAASRDIAIEVDSVSLSTILKENGIQAPYLLKSDCKGCEMQLVRDEAISRFQLLKIEYTLSGGQNVGDLISQLRARGFDKFRVYKPFFVRCDLAIHGMIMAMK